MSREISRAILYRLVILLSRPLVRVIFRPAVRGVEHIPRGGVVLAPNHLSGFDAWAVAFPTAPRVIRNMGKVELFRRRLLGSLVRSLGAFPAHAAPGLEGGIEEATRLAQAGYAVVIIPEGARKRPDREHRPRTGAAAVALAAGVPLVPVALRGTDAWRRLHRWHIAFGAPIPIGDLSDEEPARAAREVTQRLWERIGELGETLEPRRQ